MPSICCGSGGGVRSGNPEEAAALGSKRGEEIKKTGAEIVITSCPFCEFHIAGHTDKPVKNIATVLLEGYREKDRQKGESGWNSTRVRLNSNPFSLHVFIRYSYASSAAFAPSPAAMMICLLLTLVTSPAAKIPGTLVLPSKSTMISFFSFRSTSPSTISVFGSQPISMKTPSSLIFCSCPSRPLS